MYHADPLALAVLFHVTYERLAPTTGYETRTETRIFDPESPNGRLMLAVCAEIQSEMKGERDASIKTERERCTRVVNAARAGDLDSDLRSIRHYIESGYPYPADKETDRE